MPDRRDDTSANSSVRSIEQGEDTKPSAGEDTGLTERHQVEGDEALARDDLPKDERIEHQNDLA